MAGISGDTPSLGTVLGGVNSIIHTTRPGLGHLVSTISCTRPIVTLRAWVGLPCITRTWVSLTSLVIYHSLVWLILVFILMLWLTTSTMQSVISSLTWIVLFISLTWLLWLSSLWLHLTTYSCLCIILPLTCLLFIFFSLTWLVLFIFLLLTWLVLVVFFSLTWLVILTCIVYISDWS